MLTVNFTVFPGSIAESLVTVRIAHLLIVGTYLLFPPTRPFGLSFDPHQLSFNVIVGVTKSVLYPYTANPFASLLLMNTEFATSTVVALA